MNRTLKKGGIMPLFLEKFYWLYAFQMFTVACETLVRVPLDFLMSLLNTFRPCLGLKPINHTSFLAFIIVIGYCIVTLEWSFLDVSVLYHSFRGQSSVKLYGAGLALEISEKLLTMAGSMLLVSLYKILGSPSGGVWGKVGI